MNEPDSHTTPQHMDLGEQGELLATAHLLAKGYAIRHRNWKMGKKEIDIVAENHEGVVFVEVKTRHTNAYGNPETAVTLTKQRNIIAAARAYINIYKLDCRTRFDIIAIVLEKGHAQIQHIEDAFRPRPKYYS